MELKEALTMNDLSHRKTLVEDAQSGLLTRERFLEIEQEAILWLKHVLWTHTETKASPQESQGREGHEGRTNCT